MKQFLTLLTLILIVGSTKATTEKYRLIIVDDPATKITIAWDQVSGSNPVVYYDVVDHGVNTGAYAFNKSVDRSISYRGMNNQFARLSGLTPNTAYYFVIEDDQGTSSRYWFKTAPNDNSRLSFIAGGDSRNNRQPRRNANLLVAKLKPHAVLFGGDMTDDDTNAQWADWFQDWQLTIASDNRMFPIVPARGNHEGSSVVYNLFDTPNSTSYYASTFGDDLVRVYTLNSEISVLGNQKTWLENDLIANSSTRWKTAQYHKPMRPHTASKSEGNDIYSAWSQLFYDHYVRLVVDCDSHMAKTTWPVEPSSSSGNDEGFILNQVRGTVYAGEGCWGAPLRSNDDDKSWTRNSGSFNQFKLIFVDYDKIELRTIKVDNAASVADGSNTDPFTLPANLDVWTPSNGAVVEILPSSSQETLSFPIVDGSDDVEETQAGLIYPSSSDLEIVYDSYEFVTGVPNDYQVVGLRFQNVLIPADAEIDTAYIQFRSDEVDTLPAKFVIYLQDTGNAGPFSDSTNVSSRTMLTDTVIWEPAGWTSSGLIGVEQRTADLSGLLQQIIDRSDWASGNTMAFGIKGLDQSLTNPDAKRVADSFEGSSSNPPTLVCTFTSTAVNPEIEFTPTTPLVYLSGTSPLFTVDVIESGGGVDSIEFFVNGSKVGTDFSSPYELSQSFPDGQHTIIAKATTADGLTDETELMISVGAFTATVSFPILNGEDDVEETETGVIYSSSSDLEMSYDSYSFVGSTPNGFQKIGLRFQKVGVPGGATINDAYIQFYSDETDSDPAEFYVYLEDVGDGLPFEDNTMANVSARVNLSDSLYWAPDPWTATNLAGLEQQVPGLTGMVQQVVNRSDWAQGNSMVFSIKSTGVSSTSQTAIRVADSFDGNASQAAALHVTYAFDAASFLNSTKEVFKAAPVKIYPNPFIDGINIELPSRDAMHTVSVYDVSGRIVHTSEHNSIDGRIEIAPNVATGIYFLNIRDSKGTTIATKKIIKN